jgi:aminodeoxyfutalosine synthase
MGFDFAFYQNLGLGDIYGKVQSGRRLDMEDGLRLFACKDILAVGSLAHTVRTRLHGNTAYYVMNQHINYSNLCVNKCRFCAFGKEQGDPLAFELLVPQILDKIKERGLDHTTEIHIVGGCHPDLPLSYYESLLREIKALRPSIVIKAFTAVEIDHFARKEGVSTGDVLQRLKAAGLDMLPGGGAEIFSPRVRTMLCPNKTPGEDWLKVSREAHRLGIKTNATMLYGHIETPEERLQHLAAIRELQDETGGFVCFIPLPFQTANSGLTEIEPSTGVTDLQTMAISRLMLDNLPHLKAYWIMLTVKLAQVALYFGADDFDGTVIEEKIGHMAGAQSEQALTRLELERIIREGGFEPVERNSFFERIV